MNISVTSLSEQDKYKHHSLIGISAANIVSGMTTKPSYIAEEAARLKAIYKARKSVDPSLNQEKVAHDCGWASQSVVSQYMTGKIPLNIAALMSLSRALSFAPHEVSPRLAETLGIANQPSLGSVENATNMGSAGRLLPVVGYVKAGAFCEAVAFQASDADEWVEAGGPAGPRSFILRVEGFSMEPDFKPGEKVVIDPDMQWETGDFVVAKRVRDQAVTLKQLRREGGEFYLYATNPDWPERIIRMDEEWSICGRARRKIVDL
ncbi:helix-turn-helix domain-containing protein [Pseudomonas palmensis]|uniref:helix-turn-helix domain-containing protein n=2 Tax=Pseudomonas TaxID=286 RepID=UPI002E2D428D|nr:XRE family transcriptional regulator [Pseudomonas palmensis]